MVAASKSVTAASMRAARTGAVFGRQVGQQLVVERLVAALQRVRGLGEPGADPVAKLGGRGARERDHEELVDRHRRFGHVAQREAGERVASCPYRRWLRSRRDQWAVDR